MPHTLEPSRDLLFGLLALQTGLIHQAQLLAAFHAWTQARDRTMAEILAEQGALETPCLTIVEGLVIEHLRRHGSDPDRSLAAIGVGRSTRECLARIGGAELDASLAHLGSGTTESDADPDRTASHAVGTASYPVDTASGDGPRFRVLRPHARGGLGVVFVALDTELHREVALKQILDDHTDDAASRRRFLLEAEITGGLEHPGIVPVYGLGTYGDGRPYYAMRFIRGDTLKEAIERFHADAGLRKDPGQRSLELRKLLRRFTDVCNAIDYAHSRGVLHRDLKPRNIIVGQYGETLVVDWGLAKATGRSDPASGEPTLRPASSASGSAETRPGSALGTPAYMSPEQAEGDLERLGPRSDVYSLGASLYELLTGKPPLAGDAVKVIPRVQRGDFPPPRAIDPSIDRALEAICRKAMAKRSEDRYGSCRALAEDLDCWMADEPVSTYREPLSARARRWARHHRTGVTGAAAALLAGLIGLAAVAAVQTRANARLKGAYAVIARANVRLREANATTTRALAETSEAKKATEKALGESEESRRQAEAVSTFLVEAFRSPDPRQDGRQVKVADLLDRAAEKLDRGFSGTQVTKGTLLDALAETYFGLGLNDKAVATHTKARAVRETALGPDHPETLASRNNLAEAFRGAGRSAEAIALHEETLKLKESRLGADHPETLASRNNLATAYWAAGRMSEAIALHEATLRLFESRFGIDHPNTLTSRANLASAYWSAGRVSEAIVLNEGTLKLRESKLGPDHPNTLVTRSNLAIAYASVGRTSEAIALHEGTLKLRESKLGPDHPDTLTSRHSLAVAYRASGRISDAVALWEGMLPTARRVFGSGHPNTLRTTTSLASALESLGRWAEAEALWREVLGQRRKAAPTDSPPLADALDGLGTNLGHRSRWSEAEAVLRESLALRAKAPPDDWRRFFTMSLLGGALLGHGRYAEAEPLVVQGYEGMRAREAKIPAPNKPRLFEAAERVTRLYEAWGKPAQAQAWKEKLGLADLPADVFTRP